MSPTESLPLYDGSDLEALAELPNYQGWIIEHFRPYLGGRVVELGAGIGAMSRLMLPLVGSLDVVEPSPNLLPRLRQTLGDHPVAIHGASLEQHLAAVPDGTYHGIVMVNVLEHIQDDTRVLVECHRVLRPGGHLMLFVPALPALFSRMDRMLGHHRRYRRDGLIAALAAQFFDVVQARYVDSLGALAWWLIFTKLGRLSFDGRLTRLFDEIGVPLTRRLDVLHGRRFGKNIVAVARRPAS